MNILIVEDEKDLAEAVKHILQKAGHSADIAGDGLLALDYIRTEGYDLILLDIMLPGRTIISQSPSIRRSFLQESGR